MGPDGGLGEHLDEDDRSRDDTDRNDGADNDFDEDTE